MKHVLLVLIVLLFSCSKRNEEVVAEINGHKLYASELSQVTTQETFDLLNMAYEIKIRALDDLIKQKLIEYEALDRGVLTDEEVCDYKVRICHRIVAVSEVTVDKQTIVQ